MFASIDPLLKVCFRQCRIIKIEDSHGIAFPVSLFMIRRQGPNFQITLDTWSKSHQKELWKTRNVSRILHMFTCFKTFTWWSILASPDILVAVNIIMILYLHLLDTATYVKGARIKTLSRLPLLPPTFRWLNRHHCHHNHFHHSLSSTPLPS